MNVLKMRAMKIKKGQIEREREIERDIYGEKYSILYKLEQNNYRLQQARHRKMDPSGIYLGISSRYLLSFSSLSRQEKGKLDMKKQIAPTTKSRRKG